MATLDKEDAFYYFEWSAAEDPEVLPVIENLDWISENNRNGELGFNEVCAKQLAEAFKNAYVSATENRKDQTALTYAKLYALFRPYKELELPSIV